MYSQNAVLFSHVFCREVAKAAITGPVGDGLSVKVAYGAVLFGESRQDIASHPEVIRCTNTWTRPHLLCRNEILIKVMLTLKLFPYITYVGKKPKTIDHPLFCLL